MKWKTAPVNALVNQLSAAFLTEGNAALCAVFSAFLAALSAIFNLIHQTSHLERRQPKLSGARWKSVGWKIVFRVFGELLAKNFYYFFPRRSFCEMENAFTEEGEKRGENNFPREVFSWKFLILIRSSVVSVFRTSSTAGWINGERNFKTANARKNSKLLGNLKWLKFYAWRDKINNLMFNVKLNFLNSFPRLPRCFMVIISSV